MPYAQNLSIINRYSDNHQKTLKQKPLIVVGQNSQLQEREHLTYTDLHFSVHNQKVQEADLALGMAGSKVH